MKFICFFTVFFVLINAAAQSKSVQFKEVLTIAQDGSGEYTSIQDAIDITQAYPLKQITLFIKNGIYNEKIELPATHVNMSFIGENADSTVIAFGDYAGKGKHNVFTSFTAKISGNRFSAKNITFKNNAKSKEAALALFVDADKAVFENCKFIGNQQAVFTGGENSKQYFLNCYIEGATDVIFGPATAVFENCKIKVKANSNITAASTPSENFFGYVFLKSFIFADSSLNNIHLGRPWRPNAKTVFLYCNLPKAISAAGWKNLEDTNHKPNIFYAEYKNNGSGAASGNRVSWAKQLTDQEAKSYNLKNIFNTQNNWYSPNSKAFDKKLFIYTKVSFINLYDSIPNNKVGILNPETVTEKDGVVRYSNVTQPTLMPYIADNPNGKAVVVCPGGGYSVLAMSKEGNALAKAFNKIGISAFVLKYRLPNDTFNIDKSVAPLQDVQQAIRYIRQNANTYKIDKNQIGIMGSSAGGHLAASASVHYDYKADINNTDTISCKPNYTILLYPVISFDSSIAHKGSKNRLIGSKASQEKIDFYSLEKRVNTSTPPTFIVHAADDATVSVENSIRYYQACVKNKVLVEMHLYPNGGHGFGLNNKTTSDLWFDRLSNWLLTLK